MANNIPGRWDAHNAYMKLGLASITGYEYTTAADFNTLPIFGPVRNIDIDDPFVKLDQTAGGDLGRHEIFNRRDVWTVRCDAMQDAAAVFGDSRFRTLIGLKVEFIVLLETGFFVCKGLGKIQGRVALGAQQGETMMRDMEITRCHGGTLGNIIWADLATGVF